MSRQSQKRKPKLIRNAKEDGKPLPPPKKFIAFTPHDSNAIESAYQDIADKLDDPQTETGGLEAGSSATRAKSRRDTGGSEVGQDVKVAVHEDFLFDVDISNRELTPAYWLGPIYEVRRGRYGVLYRML